MAVFKCKMCGGSMTIDNSSGIATCEYCGSVQTLPRKNDETITNLFNRANNLRIKSEFDKALHIYEKILNEDNTDAEAHWGVVLCKYGIEYVEDPKTLKRIPTCHRTQYESILSDIDYISALANSEGEVKAIYKQQAEEIAVLQKDILEIVKNEEPFDVFICYKETDESGKRTVDSTLANDIYYQLTKDGLKVFYAAITLEDKLGREYEPYIFAALNSAKVMLVVGTKPEYFDAVWVRNEWSRYLKLVKADRSKLLIPCYRDMDAYDLPEEFAHLQAQDMSKIGFINDVVRGIKKIVDTTAEPKEVTVVKETAPVGNIDTLLERASMFLEDSDWKSADEYCEKVLDIEPKNSMAYFYKLMAVLEIRKEKYFETFQYNFENNANYKKVIRYGDEELVAKVQKYLEIAQTNAQERLKEEERLRIEKERKEAYKKLSREIEIKGELIYNYEDAKELLVYAKTLEGNPDAEKLIEECKERIYRAANNMAKVDSADVVEEAGKIFAMLAEMGYRDSEKMKSAILDISRKKKESEKRMLKGVLIGIGALIGISILSLLISAIAG